MVADAVPLLVSKLQTWALLIAGEAGLSGRGWLRRKSCDFTFTTTTTYKGMVERETECVVEIRIDVIVPKVRQLRPSPST